MADNMRATPRDAISGLFSDIVQGVYDFGSKPFGYSNPPAQMIMNALGVPDVAATLNRISYGEPQFTGSGMTLKPREEMINAAMAVAPFVPKVGGFAARGAGEALNSAMMGESKGLLGKIVPQPKLLDVYHGTPHRFSPTERNPLGEFDASKIGTGEGAQVYGHGLYVAEAPEVAKGYANRLGSNVISIDGKPMDFNDPVHIAASIISDPNNAGLPGKQLANAIRYDPRGIVPYGAESKVEEIAKALESESLPKFTNEKGNLYKVDLPDEKIANMLDWDNPLSQQPENVQKALKGIEKNFPEIPDFNLKKWMDADPLASTWYNTIVRDLGVDPKEISKLLQKRNVTGIKYLDEQSRGTKYSGDSAYLHASNSFKDSGYTFDQALEGMKKAYKTANEKELKDALDAVYAPKTQNFVVFPGEEKNMKILERITGDTNKLQNKVNSTPTNPFYQDPFGNPFAETIR